MLDAISDAPAWIRNGHYGLTYAMNQLARALYSPVLADPRRPANTARFVYLAPEAAKDFFVDYDQMASDAAAKLRMEAGRNPHDEQLIALVGELSTCSELFRQRWASHDVRLQRSGRKRLRHPIVGQLDLDVESVELPADPGLHLIIYTAPTATPTADGLALLASWAATQERLVTELGSTQRIVQPLRRTSQRTIRHSRGYSLRRSAALARAGWADWAPEGAAGRGIRYAR